MAGHCQTPLSTKCPVTQVYSPLSTATVAVPWAKRLTPRYFHFTFVFGFLSCLISVGVQALRHNINSIRTLPVITSCSCCSERRLHVQLTSSTRCNQCMSSYDHSKSLRALHSILTQLTTSHMTLWQLPLQSCAYSFDAHSHTYSLIPLSVHLLRVSAVIQQTECCKQVEL